MNDNLSTEYFGTRITHNETEHDAWMVQSFTAQGLGMRLSPRGSGDDLMQKYQVWNRGWKAADVETWRSSGVANVLRDYYPDSENSYLPH